MDVGVHYTCHSGPKKTPYGSKQIYYCRRSGVERVSRQNDEENKRVGKSRGISLHTHYHILYINLLLLFFCLVILNIYSISFFYANNCLWS